MLILKEIEFTIETLDMSGIFCAHNPYSSQSGAQNRSNGDKTFSCRFRFIQLYFEKVPL